MMTHHLRRDATVRVRLASQTHEITFQAHDPRCTGLQMFTLLGVRRDSTY